MLVAHYFYLNLIKKSIHEGGHQKTQIYTKYQRIETKIFWT
jgi:hypothetical protein